MCVRGIDVASFYDFDIGFWSCTDSMVLFAFDFIVVILVNHAMMKPIISRYPVNWQHESTVEVKWKSDEMNFPRNLPVNVDLFYPKVRDLFFSLSFFPSVP